MPSQPTHHGGGALTLQIVRPSTCWFIPAAALLLLGCGRLSGAPQRISQDRDLKNLDLSGWNCLTAGTGRSPDQIARNSAKNRAPIDLAGRNIPTLDLPAFLKHVAEFDAQTKNSRRKDLTPAQREKLGSLEEQIVALTGYLVLFYAGPAESTNCNSVDFHDWHLEIFQKPADHPPRPGDPTPIICEITPRTQNALYQEGIRLRELGGFFRTPELVYESTGHPARKVRVTGYLMWDDEHNKVDDVGTTIRSIGANKYHNPWRATAWEIHPVIKIEPLEDDDPRLRETPTPTQPAPSPRVDVTPIATESAAAPSAKPTETPAPPEFAVLTQSVKIKIPYGETVLPRGLKLQVKSHNAQTVTVDYMGSPYVIPISSTDLR
jgi:hypothetical protein